MTDALDRRRDAIEAAWSSVRFIIGVVFSTFGLPTELLSLRLMPRGWRADLLAWLRPAEALVRRLLLIRAAEIAAEGLPVSPPPASRRVARGAVQAAPPRATPAEDSARWRGVSFRLLLPERRPRAPRRRGRPTPFGARPLAERFEALIRAVHSPERLALRLARRLTSARSEDPVGRVLRPTRDDPTNPAREAMKRLAPLTDQADQFFSSS